MITVFNLLLKIEHSDNIIALGKLLVNEAADVIKGIAEGCRLSGCALIGGETAEMAGNSIHVWSSLNP